MANAHPTGLGQAPMLLKGISHVTAVPVVDPGTRVEYKGEQYCYIYNVGGTTAAIGEAMQLSFATGYSATRSMATDAAFPLGVVKHVDIPTTEYGWIVTRGFAPVIAGLNTALSPGEQLKMVITTNTGNISRITGIAGGTGTTVTPERVFGECRQTATTGAEGLMYVFAQ